MAEQEPKPPDRWSVWARAKAGKPWVRVAECGDRKAANRQMLALMQRRAETDWTVAAPGIDPNDRAR